MSTAGQWKHSLLKPSCKNQLYWITLYKHILFYLTASMCNSPNGSFSTNFLNLLFIFAASSYLLGAHSSPALAAQNFLWTYYRHSYYLAFSYFAQKLLKQRKQLCVASRSHILSSTHAGLQFSVFFFYFTLYLCNAHFSMHQHHQHHVCHQFHSTKRCHQF